MNTHIKMNSIAVPGANLDSYMNSIGTIPVLTKEEEIALFKQLESNNINAAKTLVMSHLRFVVYIAKSYSGYGLPMNDLIQEGNVGLMKSIKRFSLDHGVRLVSFSVHWIKAEIHEYIIRNLRIVKIATTKAQRKLFFNLRKRKAGLSWLNQQEASAIADDLGVDISSVYEMEGRLSVSDSSFHSPTDESEDTVYTAPEDHLNDESTDPAKLIENIDNYEKVISQLNNSINTLDERSKDIVNSRWLSDTKTTLFDLGRKHGISTERVRQLEAIAFAKIKISMS